MAPRPGDWTPLRLSTDPTPGEPESVQAIVDVTYGISELAKPARTMLNNLLAIDPNGFVGRTGDAFREKTDKDLSAFLNSVADSFAAANTAAKAFLTEMTQHQATADAALVAARGLPDIPENAAQREALTSQATRAREDLGNAENRFAAAVQDATAMIHSIPVDGWAIFWKIFGWLAMAVSIIAIFVGGGLGILALLMNAAVFVKTAVDYAQGKANGLELGLAFLGMLFPSTKALKLADVVKSLWNGIKAAVTGLYDAGKWALKGMFQMAFHNADWVMSFNTRIGDIAGFFKGIPPAIVDQWGTFTHAIKADWLKITGAEAFSVSKLGVYMFTHAGHFVIAAVLPINLAEVGALGVRGASRLAVMDRVFGKTDTILRNLLTDFQRGLPAGSTTAATQLADTGVKMPHVAQPTLITPGRPSFDAALDRLSQSPALAHLDPLSLKNMGTNVVGNALAPTALGNHLVAPGGMVGALHTVDSLVGHNRLGSGLIVPENAVTQTGHIASGTTAGLADLAHGAPTVLRDFDGIALARGAIGHAESSFDLGIRELRMLADGDVSVVSASSAGIHLHVGGGDPPVLRAAAPDAADASRGVSRQPGMSETGLLGAGGHRGGFLDSLTMTPVHAEQPKIVVTGVTPRAGDALTVTTESSTRTTPTTGAATAVPTTTAATTTTTAVGHGAGKTTVTATPTVGNGAPAPIPPPRPPGNGVSATASIDDAGRRAGLVENAGAPVRPTPAATGDDLSVLIPLRPEPTPVRVDFHPPTALVTDTATTTTPGASAYQQLIDMFGVGPGGRNSSKPPGSSAPTISHVDEMLPSYHHEQSPPAYTKTDTPTPATPATAAPPPATVTPGKPAVPGHPVTPDRTSGVVWTEREQRLSRLGATHREVRTNLDAILADIKLADLDGNRALLSELGVSRRMNEIVLDAVEAQARGLGIDMRVGSRLPAGGGDVVHVHTVTTHIRPTRIDVTSQHGVPAGRLRHTSGDAYEFLAPIGDDVIGAGVLDPTTGRITVSIGEGTTIHVDFTGTVHAIDTRPTVTHSTLALPEGAVTVRRSHHHPLASDAVLDAGGNPLVGFDITRAGDELVVSGPGTHGPQTWTFGPGGHGARGIVGDTVTVRLADGSAFCFVDGALVANGIPLGPGARVEFDHVAGTGKVTDETGATLDAYKVAKGTDGFTVTPAGTDLSRGGHRWLIGLDGNVVHHDLPLLARGEGHVRVPHGDPAGASVVDVHGRPMPGHTVVSDGADGFTVTSTNHTWHIAADGTHTGHRVTLPSGEILDFVTTPTGREVRAGDGTVLATDAGGAYLHNAGSRGAEVRFGPDGFVESEQIAILGKNGKPRGAYWQIDHTSGTAIKHDMDGVAKTGRYDTGVTLERPGRDRMVIRHDTGGGILFERDILGNGHILDVFKGRAKTRWTEHVPGGTDRHGFREYAPDRRTTIDVAGGPFGTQQRMYHKLEDGGWVRAERGETGTWTWTRFDAKGVETLHGTRTWQGVPLLSMDIQGWVDKVGDRIVQRHWGSWSGLEHANHVREYGVGFDAVENAYKVEKTYVETAGQNAETGRMELTARGDELTITRIAEQRVPQSVWEHAAGVKAADLGPHGGGDLFRTFKWAERDASGAVTAKGVRWTTMDGSVYDIDEFGRLVRAQHKLQDGGTVTVGRDLAQPGKWASAPGRSTPDVDLEIPFTQTTGAGDVIKGIRHIDGADKFYRDVDLATGHMLRRSQGDGIVRHYSASPTGEGLIASLERPDRFAGIGDASGVWTDRNMHNQIVATREDWGDVIIRSKGKPSQAKWTWTAEPSRIGGQAPEHLGGTRIQNRGDFASKVWDDSFTDLAGDIELRQSTMLDKERSIRVDFASGSGTGAETRIFREIGGAGTTGTHTVVSDTHWTQTIEGNVVREWKGGRVREFTDRPVDSATGDPIGDARHSWREFDDGKVVYKSEILPGSTGQAHRISESQWGQWQEFDAANELVARRVVSGRVYGQGAPSLADRFTGGRIGDAMAVDGGFSLIGRESDFRGSLAEFRAYNRQMRDVFHDVWVGAREGEPILMSLAKQEGRKLAIEFGQGFLFNYTTSLIMTAVLGDGELNGGDALKAFVNGLVGGVMKAGLTTGQNRTAFGDVKRGWSNWDQGKPYKRHSMSSADDWASEWSIFENVTRWRSAGHDMAFGLVANSLTAFVNNALNAHFFGIGPDHIKLGGVDALAAGAWGMAGSLTGGLLVSSRGVFMSAAGSRLWHRGGLGELGLLFALDLGEKFWTNWLVTQKMDLGAGRVLDGLSATPIVAGALAVPWDDVVVGPFSPWQPPAG